MNSRAYKTSAVEVEAFRSNARGDGLRRLTKRERTEKYGPAEFMPDEEIPFGLGRSSDHMPAIRGDDLGVLDGLLERHGFAKVLRTLRELCDARTGHDEGGLDSFEAIPDEKEWQERGDALETLLVRLARGTGV